MGAYEEKLQQLLADYKREMMAHHFKMEKLMGTEEIPIYVRWQELKHCIRAFGTLTEQSEQTVLLLDQIHKKD